MQKIDADRIMLVLFLFRRHGLDTITNNSLAETTVYRTHEDYIEVREKLARVGYIHVLQNGRLVQITQTGLDAVLRLLSISNQDAIQDFVTRLRVFTVFPIRLSRERLQSFFDFLVLTYSNVCSDDPVRDLSKAIAEDHKQGLDNSLWQRIQRALVLFYRNNYEDARLYRSLFDWFSLIQRYAYIVRLWSFYRHNRIALQTVVSFPASATSGVLGSLFKLFLGMILMLIIQLLLIVLGLTLPLPVFPLPLVLFIAVLYLADLPRLIESYRD